MPNNSKLPLQTQPSTLDIVLRNGQMNLATAIGRLEQAVTKAYGNINSSINSKQGEFNQALLKTLDQSISKSSNKMDQFYTSSFAKIYALNSAIMEQSLQKNGMAAAQKDLDGYRNLDKLIENQQRAFSDMNVSLKQIIEKIAPMTSEQKMIQTANAAQVNNADYMDVSMFEQITSRYNVSQPEAQRSFKDIQTNLFDVRNTENFDKDPFIEALTKNNAELLKKLKGTSNRTDFIMLLIENISKAYEDNNQDILQNIPKYIKKPGIWSTFIDKDIHLPTAFEKKYPEVLQNTVYQKAYNNAQREKDINEEMKKRGYHYNSVEKDNNSRIIDLLARFQYYGLYLDNKNQEYTKKYNSNPNELVNENVKKDVSNQYDEEYKDDYAFSVLKAMPHVGDLIVDTTKRFDKSMIYNTGYKTSPEDINDLFNHSNTSEKHQNQKSLSDSEKEIQYLQQKKIKLETEFKNTVFTKDMQRIAVEIKRIDDEIKRLGNSSTSNFSTKQSPNVNLPKSLLSPVLIKQPEVFPSPIIRKNIDPLDINIKPSQFMQSNRDIANMHMGLKPQFSKGNRVTVHNHNEFKMTFNKGDYDPNTFMSSVNHQISSMTAEAISRYKALNN